MSHPALVLLALSSTYILLGAYAVLRVTRPRAAAPDEAELPAISVLKPLRGADDDLERNLESFFLQAYPRERFELVFGVEDPSDPAIEIVRRLQARHPDVRSVLAIHPGPTAANPKVSNLRGMLPHAAHDLVLISDSNISAPQLYLRDLAATYLRDGPRAGIVSNLFAGTGERDLGAALENVQVNGFIAAGAALPVVCGDPIVVGKSMLFSRSVFERLGGLASVADVLAEDYMIGKMFQHAGYRVRLAGVALENVTRRATVRRVFDRHLRWSILRARLHPIAFALEPLASPLVMLPLAIACFGLPSAALWAAAAVVLRDVFQWIVLRGPRRAWLPILLAPFRDALMLAVWAITPFVKHIEWRGHRVRVGAGTRVFVPEGTIQGALQDLRVSAASHAGPAAAHGLHSFEAR